MKRIVQSRDSNGILQTLALEDGDFAVLDRLRHERDLALRVTISAASAHEETIFITLGGRHYEFKRRDLFK